MYAVYKCTDPKTCRYLDLTSQEPISELIIWKKVYVEGTESECYLLVVAMNHMILATVVESGFSEECQLGPDPVLVEQAEATLYQLHSFHVHAACEETIALDVFLTISQERNKAKEKKMKPKDINNKMEG